MANIRDVATMANVSAATVSRVINGGPVKAATREKVLKTIETLNFIPNANARGLGLGRAGMFGVIVPTMVYGYYAQIVEGIARALAQTHYEMALRVSYHQSGAEDILVRLLGEKRVDALIIVTPREFNGKSSCQDFPSDIPIVFLDGSSSDQISAISGNNFDGGFQAGRHLMELGHHKCGMILGQTHCTESAERLAGFRKALALDGVTLEERNLRYSNYMTEGGQQVALELLSESSRPTALFCANDLMAYGALLAAESLGIKVPEDLSIIGYDNTSVAEWARPPLTTIHQPTMAMGEAGVAYLLKQIEEKESPHTKQMLLPVNLVKRSSTGLAPK